MEQFSFVTYSTRRYYTIFFTLALLAVAFVAEDWPKDLNKLFIIVYFLIVMTAIAFIARRYSKQHVEVSLTDDFLTIDWISLPVYTKRENQKIKWNNIGCHKYGEDKEFVLFHLIPVDGKKISLGVNKSEDRKEFDRFVASFEKRREENI